MSPPKVQAGGILRKSRDLTWRTPESILERVRVYFRGQIPFDAASAPDNPTKAARFCAGPSGTLFAKDSLESKNGLVIPWGFPTWINPPFAREWIVKLRVEADRGQEIVALLPTNRFETTYMQTTLTRARAVCFHRDRVAFISSIDGAPVSGNPYASWLLGFNVDVARFGEAFSPLGSCFATKFIDDGERRGLSLKSLNPGE